MDLLLVSLSLSDIAIFCDRLKLEAKKVACLEEMAAQSPKGSQGALCLAGPWQPCCLVGVLRRLSPKSLNMLGCDGKANF